MADRISTWTYKVSKGTKWAYEVRKPNLGIKVQRRGFATRGEALRAAKETRLALDKGARPKSDMASFNDVLESYLEHLEGAIRPHTIANYRDLLVRYALPSLGEIRISEIDEPKLTRLLAAMTARGLRPSTVNTLRARLIGLFGYAKDRGFIEVNPASKTRRKSLEQGKQSLVQEPLNEQEARRLLEAAKNSNLDVFLALTLGLGLRKGEALGLQWQDIDLEAGTLAIQRSRGQQRYTDQHGRVRSTESDGGLKTASARRSLPISSLLLGALMRSSGSEPHLPNDYVVSPGGGRPMSLAVLTRSYQKLVSNSGNRYVRIHDLRHTAAVIALSNDAPLEAVSQSLGHSGLDVTKRVYAPRVKALDDAFVSAIDRGVNSLTVEEIRQGVSNVSGS